MVFSRSETKTPDVDSPMPAARAAKPKASHASKKKESTDWILDCEICKRYGKNLVCLPPSHLACADLLTFPCVQDGDQDLVSCGTCSRWQHIVCHDNADVRAGRLRRNWDSQQFTCSRCRIEQANRRATAYTYHNSSGPGQWQDGSVHLHPTPSASSWGAPNATSSPHHATLPTSDLRGSYPPSNHLTNHTSHSGISYQTIPLSQSPYAGLSRTQSGSSGYPTSYPSANHIPYGAPTNGIYSGRGYTGGSQYPVSDHRTHSPMQEVCSLILSKTLTDNLVVDLVKSFTSLSRILAFTEFFVGTTRDERSSLRPILKIDCCTIPTSFSARALCIAPSSSHSFTTSPCCGEWAWTSSCATANGLDQ